VNASLYNPQESTGCTSLHPLKSSYKLCRPALTQIYKLCRPKLTQVYGLYGVLVCTHPNLQAIGNYVFYNRTLWAYILQVRIS